MRAWASFLVAAWGIPAKLRGDPAWWLVPALALAIFATWGVLEELCRREPGGGVPALASVSVLAASYVTLYAFFPWPAEVLSALGPAVGGLAAAAALRKFDAGGMAPVVAVLLPGVLVVTNYYVPETNPLPWRAFAFAAAGPAALLVTLAPPFDRLAGWKAWALRGGLVLGCAAAAAWLAVQSGTLVRGGEEW